jgi:hypothetical protein
VTSALFTYRSPSRASSGRERSKLLWPRLLARLQPPENMPPLSRPRGAAFLARGHLHDQVVAMLAAVFVDDADRDRMGAGFEVAGEPRRPDVRRRLGLDPGLLGRLALRANSSSTKGSGRATRSILTGARLFDRCHRQLLRWRPAHNGRVPVRRRNGTTLSASLPARSSLHACITRRRPHGPAPPLANLSGDRLPIRASH